MSGVWTRVIEKYYSNNLALKELLIRHSECVARKSLRIAAAHSALFSDLDFIEEAAMLHDVGIFMTSAPPIHCHGTHHYLCHGYLGADLLRAEGLPRHALVAERHTGTGISLSSIIEKGLPLPHRDFLPVSMEEQLICYADKFFSKTKPDCEKSPEEAERSLLKFGEEGAAKFREWHRMFA